MLPEVAFAIHVGTPASVHRACRGVCEGEIRASPCHHAPLWGSPGLVPWDPLSTNKQGGLCCAGQLVSCCHLNLVVSLKYVYSTKKQIYFCCCSGRDCGCREQRERRRIRSINGASIFDAFASPEDRLGCKAETE